MRLNLKNVINWGIIIIIPLHFSCFDKDKENCLPFLADLPICETASKEIEIIYGDYFALNCTQDSIETNPIEIPLIQAVMDFDELLFLSSATSDTKSVYLCDTNGILLNSFKLGNSPNYPQIVDDTLLLFTVGKYNRSSILTDREGELLKEISLPLTKRPVGVHYLLGDKLFRVGLEDKKEYSEGEYNWGIGIYEFNTLLPSGKAGRFSQGMIEHFFNKVKVFLTSSVQFFEKENDIWGVLSNYPVIFKYDMVSSEEFQWRIPIDGFFIPDLSSLVLPDKERELRKHLETVEWSLQYYAGILDNSHAYVFRGYHEPWFIDFYNLEGDSPIWLGSVCPKEHLQPICGFRDRILFLDVETYLDNKKISFIYGYIRYNDN